MCGMFVAKYPEWIASVLNKDGHTHHFDGAKDLFKYLQDLPKWAPDHNIEEIKSIGVTEYYGLTLIDSREAYYVIGSDVLGPIGHELHQRRMQTSFCWTTKVKPSCDSVRLQKSCCKIWIMGCSGRTVSQLARLPSLHSL